MNVNDKITREMSLKMLRNAAQNLDFWLDGAIHEIVNKGDTPENISAQKIFDRKKFIMSDISTLIEILYETKKVTRYF